MNAILEKYAPHLQEKAKKIKMLIFDVDGVLTDGGIIYTNSGDELKKFHVRDGQILKPLRTHGFILGAITGRDSELVAKRCRELELDFFHQGIKSKHSLVERILIEYSLSWEQLAYIGDDLIDLGTLEKAGLSFMPSDAPYYLHSFADIVTFAAGGKGVVREVGDYLLSAGGKLAEVIEEYKNRA